LKKYYIKVTGENQKNYYVFSCNTVEKIDEYIKSLYIPGSSNLIVFHYGDIAFRNDRNKRGAICPFTEKESKILYFLYTNQNMPQKTKDIMRECKCSREDIKSACSSIRGKLITNLKYTKEESEIILPKNLSGSYMLNAYLDNP